jgi:hypothetical protein
MRSIGQIEPIAVRAGKLRGVMTDKRKAFERIMTQLPQLQERHAARMIARNVLGGDTLDMVKSFFDDLNEVKWMLVDVESNSLPALNMFILYLDYFECTADAWKLRLLTKRKFPKRHDQDRTTRYGNLPAVGCPPPQPPLISFTLLSQEVDFSLTTLAAVVQVNYHTITTVTHSASPIIPYDIKPKCDVDAYRCTGASSIHIAANNLRFDMVFIYLFSDTVYRRHEEIDLQEVVSANSRESRGLSWVNACRGRTD